MEWKKLGEVFSRKTGYTPSKNNIEFWNNGEIFWFTIEDIRQRGQNLSYANVKISKSAVKKELFKANSIVLSIIGTIGEYALIETDFVINQQFIVLSLKEEYQEKINMNYIKYYFSKISQYCKRNVRQSNVPTIDPDKILKLEIPIPSLETQEKVVKILDKFDTLINDLSQGLPKEIELRQKQYEYYREKLLDFPKEN